MSNLIAQYKFDKSLYDNLIPEFSVEFTNYEIVDEYLDTEDIMVTSTETMMIMEYDAEPDEYGVLTTEYDVENISTFNAENIVTRSIYSDSLPTQMRFGSTASSGSNSLLEILYLNTSELTAMDNMFIDCQSLTTVDLNNSDTGKVTTMSGMFQGCRLLTSLNISNFNTSNVTNMGYMFFQCQKLSSLDVNGWNVGNVNDIQFMFKFCNALTELDLSKWNVTAQLSNAYQSFCACQNLKRLNISNWNLSNTRIASIFDLNNNLDNIIMANSNYASVNKVISALPTRTSESPGTLNIIGIDDISQADITSAQAKYWNVVQEECEEPNNNELIQGDIIEDGSFNDETTNVVRTNFIDVSDKKSIKVTVLTDNVYVSACYLYNANKELIKVIDLSSDKKRMLGVNLQELINQVLEDEEGDK